MTSLSPGSSSAQAEKAAANWPLWEPLFPGPGPDAPWWPHGAHNHQNLGPVLRLSLGRHPCPWPAVSPCACPRPPALAQVPARSTARVAGPSIPSERAAHKHTAQPRDGSSHRQHTQTQRGNQCHQSGPGSEDGQAHVHVSCPHFPLQQKGAVWLSHVATRCVPPLQPCKPPHPGILSTQQRLESLTPLYSSLTSLHTQEEISPEVSSKSALRPGLTQKPTPEPPVTSSQRDIGGLLS